MVFSWLFRLDLIKFNGYFSCFLFSILWRIVFPYYVLVNVFFSCHSRSVSAFRVRRKQPRVIFRNWRRSVMRQFSFRAPKSHRSLHVLSYVFSRQIPRKRKTTRPYLTLTLRDSMSRQPRMRRRWSNSSHNSVLSSTTSMRYRSELNLKFYLRGHNSDTNSETFLTKFDDLLLTLNIEVEAETEIVNWNRSCVV